MRKIALLIPSLQVGGMERVMTELANYLAQQPGIDVHLILYGRNRDIFYSLSDRVQVYKPKFKFGRHVRIISTLRTVIFLRNRIQVLRPDCILSFGEYWNSFILLGLLDYSYPIFVSDRCSPIKELGTIHNFLRKQLYSRTTGVIVQTEAARNIYARRLPTSRIITIANPIRSFNGNPKQSKEKIVLSVGRLIRTKHHDLLIRIFHEIGMPDWKLLIIGDDAQKQENKVRLNRLIRDMNAESSIFLLGNRVDVDEFYGRASVFAFTSSSEGFPNVIGEALSAGLPAVAFDCIAGPSELIIDGHNGFLVPLFDADVFRERLQLLMEDELLRRGMQNNARSSIEPYTSDRIFGKYQRILEDYSYKA